MRALFAIVLLYAAMTGFAGANPIAVDVGEPLALIAESVEIAVEENQSVVSGTYSFRRVENGWPYQPGERITIKVPIIVHGPQSFASLKSSTAVSLSLGRQVFHPLRMSVDSPLYDLPSGWQLRYAEFEIPHRALRGVFTVAIRYVQPHLPGRLAPYYPIHPPERWAGRSFVCYSAAERASLALVSRGQSVIEAGPTHISIQPQHHKLILVRVNKSPDHAKERSQ
jgi:hypothetical protein